MDDAAVMYVLEREENLGRDVEQMVDLPMTGFRLIEKLIQRAPSQAFHDEKEPAAERAGIEQANDVFVA